VREFAHEDRRLITSYSSARAKKDQFDRSRLIERLKKKSKGRDTLPVGEIINNAGTAKFLKVEKANARIDDKKITEDARWDGMHGIITNVHTASVSSLLSRYRGLWQIEEAFRINKHDLAMRPIFHWTEKRIRAHVAICFLAYATAKHTTHKLQASGLQLSFARLRDELLLVQASILINVRTRKCYRLPSKLTDLQKKIFRAIGLRRSEVPELSARQ
jgi:transposase